MKLIPGNEPSAHWYNPKTGESAHDADLRRARKERLYPSVTSIQQELASPGLENWKIQEAILSALTLPRNNGESDNDFAVRIMEDSKSHAKQSAEIGTSLHDWAEKYINGESPKMVKGYETACKQLQCWIDENIQEGVCEETIISHDYGYAGRVDFSGKLRDGRLAIIDWKSSGVKIGAKPVFYDKWCGQLAAYAEGRDRALISVVIGTRQDNQIVAAKEWSQEEIDANWSIFKHCLAIWKLKRGYDPLTLSTNL